MASKQSRLFVCLYRQLLAVNQAIFHNFFFSALLLLFSTCYYMLEMVVVATLSRSQYSVPNINRHLTMVHGCFQILAQLESVKLSKCIQLLIWPISKSVKLHYKFYFDYHKELFRLGVLYFILSYSVYVNARVSLGYPYN